MKKIVISAALILAASSSAHALEGKWYTKVNFGVSVPDADLLEDFVSNEILTDLGIVENVDFDYPRAYSISLGYRLNHYIAFEAGYANLGETTERQSYWRPYGSLELYDLQGIETHTYKSKITSSTQTLAAVFSTDVSQSFSAGAKIGYHLWNTKYRAQYFFLDEYQMHDSEGNITAGSWQFTENRLSNSIEGEDPFYGAFVNWRIGKWMYSAEHTLYTTDEADLTMSSVSLSMDF